MKTFSFDESDPATPQAGDRFRRDEKRWLVRHVDYSVISVAPNPFRPGAYRIVRYVNVCWCADLAQEASNECPSTP